MKSVAQLINKLPEILREHVIKCDLDEVMGYFFEDGVTDIDSAYLVSVIATHIDTVTSHRMAESVFEHTLNWMPTSFDLAAYHGFRILELKDFKDVDAMKGYIGNAEHPDYDVISNARFRFVADKIKAIEPNYKCPIPDNVHEIELPDILDKKVMKAMKNKTYSFKGAQFGITRKAFEDIFGQPTDIHKNSHNELSIVSFYRSRYKNSIMVAIFKGSEDMSELDYQLTEVNYYYGVHQEISKKMFKNVWGKPGLKFEEHDVKYYQYDYVHVLLEKHWDDKFYVKQIWYGEKVLEGKHDIKTSMILEDE